MQNCWEFKKCGRQAGGPKAVELGVCPASTDTAHNGINGGKNGGRICWAVTKTLCGGEVQGSYTQKSMNCAACEFFHLVRKEQGGNLQMLKKA